MICHLFTLGEIILLSVYTSILKGFCKYMAGKLLVIYFTVINNNGNFSLGNKNFENGWIIENGRLPAFIIGFILYYHSRH